MKTRSEHDANLYLQAPPRPGAHYNPRMKASATIDDFYATIIYILTIFDVAVWSYVGIEWIKGF